jgi:hypothetical protein
VALAEVSEIALNALGNMPEQSTYCHQQSEPHRCSTKVTVRILLGSKAALSAVPNRLCVGIVGLAFGSEDLRNTDTQLRYAERFRCSSFAVLWTGCRADRSGTGGKKSGR